MKLLNTGVYLLLIDEGAEIKTNDYFVNTIQEKVYHYNIKNYNVDKEYLKLIIAYYPLKEAKELDGLPLLPEPFKDYSLNRAKEFAFNKFKETFDKYPKGGKLPIDTLKDLLGVGIETGYKFATKNKQFSLEDVKKAIEMAREGNFSNYDHLGYIDWDNSEDKIIQSLSTQQLPVSFEPEYVGGREYLAGVVGVNEIWVEYPEELKTITNSEGKQEIQGKYVY